jgi:sugar phosphate isomerase/epimerase
VRTVKYTNLYKLDPYKERVSQLEDYFNTQKNNAKILEFGRARLREDIKILHLKDMKRTKDGVTFAEVGNGNLNMDGIIKAAKSVGIRDFIVEQDTCDRDPLTSARISFENLKKIMEN